MYVRQLSILLLALPLAGCGGCGKATDPRKAVPAEGAADEQKPPVELYVRLKAATTLPQRGALPPELLAALHDDSPHVRRVTVFTVRRSGAEAKAIAAALKPLLKDKDAFIRVVVAEALWELEKDPDALLALKKVLRDGSDLRAAARAIQALGEVGPVAKDVAPELTALLKNPDEGLQRVLAEALKRIRYADVPALAEIQAEMLLRGHEDRARALARVLAALGKSAVPPLIQMMQSGEARKQKCAALAIAEVGQDGRDAVPALAALLRVRQYNTHRTALEVLAHLGPDAEPALLNLMDLLDDEDPVTAYDAAVAVGSIGRPALQPLLIRLRSKKAKNDLATVALATLGKDAIPPLLDALKSDDPAIRERAALALAGMASPPKEALPVLIELLKERTRNPVGDAFGASVGVGGFAARRRASATVRRLVAGMGHFRAEAADAVPVLVPLLKDRSSDLRILTAEALAQMGQVARPAVPALREVAADAERNRLAAIAAAKALVALPLDRKEDVPLLVELLKNSQLDRKEDEPPFVELFTDSPRLDEVRAAVVELLGRLGPDAAPAVPDMLEVLANPKKDRVTFYLPYAIARVGDAVVPQVVQAVRAKKAGWLHQGEALSYLGKPGREVLLNWMTDDDEVIRAYAILLLGALGPSPEIATALLDALNDLNGDVRRYAVSGLHPAGVEARVAVPALIKRLLDPKPMVRYFAAKTLTSYEAAARPAVPALIEALKDDDREVRAAALEALRQIGLGKEHVPALLTILEAKGTGVREALQLLPDLGDNAKAVVPALRELRKDERWEELVLIALWHVAGDGPAGTRLLDRVRLNDAQARARAVYALGGQGTSASLAIPTLCDALRDPEESVRFAACRVLVRMRADGRPAIPELIGLLQKEDQEIVTRAAYDALAEMKTAAQDAAPALKALLKKAPPREQVELNSVIWKIAAEEEALTALGALLADRESCVGAARVLGEIGAPAKASVLALRAQRANRVRTLAAVAEIDLALRRIEAK